MAINFGSRSVAPVAPVAASNGRAPAKGFINLYVPRQDGTRYKLAYIVIDGVDPVEAEMLEVLKTPNGLTQLLNAIEFDYKEVKGPNASGIAFAAQE